MEPRFVMYSTHGCADCFRLKTWLNDFDILFTQIYADEDDAAATLVLQLTKGENTIPVLVFPDDSFLINPSVKELSQKLGV